MSQPINANIPNVAPFPQTPPKKLQGGVPLTDNTPNKCFSPWKATKLDNGQLRTKAPQKVWEKYMGDTSTGGVLYYIKIIDHDLNLKKRYIGSGLFTPKGQTPQKRFGARDSEINKAVKVRAEGHTLRVQHISNGIIQAMRDPNKAVEISIIKIIPALDNEEICELEERVLAQESKYIKKVGTEYNHSDPLYEPIRTCSNPIHDHFQAGRKKPEKPLPPERPPTRPPSERSAAKTARTLFTV